MSPDSVTATIWEMSVSPLVAATPMAIASPQTEIRPQPASTCTPTNTLPLLVRRAAPMQCLPGTYRLAMMSRAAWMIS